MNRKLSLEIHSLDKEIFEKKNKKKDSKYTLNYVDVFLQLYNLFLESSIKQEELEDLYYSLENTKSHEGIVTIEKSRRNSPSKHARTMIQGSSSNKYETTDESQVKKIN